MSYATSEIAKIVAAWLGVGLVAGVLVTFIEGRSGGRRAALLVWLLGLPLPLWQIFPRRYALWIGLGALGANMLVWGWLPRRGK